MKPSVILFNYSLLVLSVLFSATAYSQTTFSFSGLNWGDDVSQVGFKTEVQHPGFQ